jgi:archaellum component FlaC
MIENMQTQDIATLLSDLNTRVRILEGKYNLTRERMLIINQNMLDHYKKLNASIKSIEDDLTELKDSINLLKDTIKDIVKELRLLARKEDLKILEKYINLWNPLNAITKEEVNEIIEKRLKNVRKK